jgi:CubicO group peptidase (beta-lactamase class C family)
MRLYCITLLLFSFLYLNAQITASQIEKVDHLFKKWDQKDSPGAAVGIIQKGNLIYTNGYGSANLDYDVPIDADSKFYIASTSKQFTAACLALLVQEGKLKLEDDIRKHIPELPDYGKTITIRHLVHHTSGLRDYLELMSLAGKSFENYFNISDGIELLCRQKALNFDPGAEYLYSNSGYILLAEIVTRVSGKSIREYADEKIFRPLGMKNTFFNDNHKQVTKNRVVSYRPEGNGYLRFVQNFDALGDGNLLTTVNDLYLWDQNFYHKKVGGSAFLDLIHTRGTLNNGKELDYAFGLGHGKYRGLKTVSHGGGMLGFRTQLIRFPEQEFSVIVLANITNFNPTARAYEIADIFLKDQLKKKKARAKNRIKNPKNKKKYQRSAAELKIYEGNYYSEELDTYYHLHLEDDRLKLMRKYADPIAVEPAQKDEFEVFNGLGQITFNREDEQVQGFVLNAGRVKGITFVKN